MHTGAEGSLAQKARRGEKYPSDVITASLSLILELAFKAFHKGLCFTALDLDIGLSLQEGLCTKGVEVLSDAIPKGDPDAAKLDKLLAGLRQLAVNVLATAPATETNASAYVAVNLNDSLAVTTGAVFHVGLSLPNITLDPRNR